MKLSDMISQNQKLQKSSKSPIYNIAILSNTTISPLKDILEYHLRIHDINPCITLGDYDNIVQDSLKYPTQNSVILFWELANIINGLHYKVEIFDESDFQALLSKTKQEIHFVLENLKSSPLVLFNTFSSLVFRDTSLKKSKLDLLCDELNIFLSQLQFPNLVIIDIEKIMARIGAISSIDFRYFYSSKSLYSVEFYKHYAEQISPVILNICGKTKKALIFDCDNTLWKGILGEDGFQGIQMSSKTNTGAIFEEIQHLAIMLAKQGIIIGLCSKNNNTDVQHVLDNHPDMRLKDEYIVIKKINWTDKATNLANIAKELNIGLDSIVFVDDSDFEISLIQEKLPSVTTIQVPKQLSNYPAIIRKKLNLFFSLRTTQDDLNRVAEYKNQISRQQFQTEFSNIDDYLKSLDIELIIHENNKEHVPRIAQLTQKTNQFNLTTKRYTETDIEQFMDDDIVISVEVLDKFGDNGITAVMILKLEDTTVSIDTFLMSCRVIGRNIEFALCDTLFEKLKNRQIETCKATYIKTLKNEQVQNLYKLFGFITTKETEEVKQYILPIKNYIEKNISYIKVKKYGTKN